MSEIVNGKKCCDGWKQEVMKAQKQTKYKYGDGGVYDRIKFGDEATETEPDELCHDCAVKVGQYHVPGCDWERCPRCGGQNISCDCP